MNLDLSMIPTGIRKSALVAFAEKDVNGVLFRMSSDYYCDFLYANRIHLTEKGMWPEALIRGWTGHKIEMGEDPRWAEILLSTPIKEFRAYSAIIPDSEFLYRGVSSNTYEIGFSWTSSYKIAKFFAKRFYRPNPRILKLKFRPEIVLFFTDDREEKEYILEVSSLSNDEFTTETLR